MIAVDGSPCADAALAEVARRRWPAGSQATLLTVVDAGPNAAVHVRRGSGTPDMSTRASPESVLERAAHALGESGLHVDSEMVVGEPKTAIVEEAKRCHADEIFLGAVGRGPVERLLTGSVSASVAANASCAVEVVRVPSLPTAVPTRASGERATAGV